MSRQLTSSVLHCGISIEVFAGMAGSVSSGEASRSTASGFRPIEHLNDLETRALEDLFSKVNNPNDRPLVRALYERHVDVSPFGKYLELSFNRGVLISETEEDSTAVCSRAATEDETPRPPFLRP